MIYKTIIQPRKQKPLVCMKKQKSPYNLIFIISNDYLNVYCKFNTKTLHFIFFLKFKRKIQLNHIKRLLNQNSLNNVISLIH